MNNSTTMKTPKILCSLAAFALAQGSLFAATTDPVGFVSVNVPAASDAIVAVPLNRTSEFKGLTSAFSGTSGTVTITVSGTPGWTNGQFIPLATNNKTYALQFASGAKEGLTMPITNNGGNTVTVTVDPADDLTGVLANGEQIDVVAYWTPASLFSSPPDGSELFSFAPLSGSAPAGTNLSPSVLLVFDAGTGVWIDQVSELSRAHLPLEFGASFGFRNNSASVYTASFVGSVPMSKHRTRLATLANNTDQDIRVGYTSPIPELLSAVGFPAVSGDQLFVYNNGATGKNKSPSQILVFDTEWLDSITESPVPTFQLQPGYGYVFRKFRTANSTVAVWTDLQSYLTP